MAAAAEVEAVRDLLNIMSTDTESFHNNVAGLLALMDQNPGLLEVRSGNDATALMLAAMVGRLDVIQRLKALGADVHAEGPHGGRAVDFACLYGWPDVVKYLEEDGLSLVSRNSSHKTPLMYAVSASRCEVKNLQVVELLLDRMGGEGLDERDNNGRTALMWAGSSGFKEYVDALLVAGATSTIVETKPVVAGMLAQVPNPGNEAEEQRRAALRLVLAHLGEHERACVLDKVYHIHDTTEATRSLLLNLKAAKSSTYALPQWARDRVEMRMSPAHVKPFSAAPTVGPAAAFNRSRKRKSHTPAMVCPPEILEQVLNMKEGVFGNLLEMVYTPLPPPEK